MSFNEEIFKPNIIILGVIGGTNKISEQDIQDNVIIKILEKLGRVPDKILIHLKDNSSMYIQNWAESLRIKHQLFKPDWVHNGKLAEILNIERITNECTHALVFLPPPTAVKTTTRLLKLAEKLTKKGKQVFTSSHNQMLTQFETLNSLVVNSETASKHARKLNKEKGQTLLKYQKKV
jgi:hypothetical protein